MDDCLQTAEGSQPHTRGALVFGEATWQGRLLVPQPRQHGSRRAFRPFHCVVGFDAGPPSGSLHQTTRSAGSTWMARLDRLPMIREVAQLGAVQVWANSLKDQQKAVANYRKALALGATVPLPQLFAAAGAKFAFDAQTLKEAVDLMEEVIEEMEAKL